MKVCCYYCEREIQPQQLESVSASEGGNNQSKPGNSVSFFNYSLSGADKGSSGSLKGSVLSNNSNNSNNSLVSAGAAAAAGNTTCSKLLWCPDCQDWAQRCVVCETAVRGTVSVCSKCGHGGHFQHMQSWFAKSKVCASGCGCLCTAAALDKHTDDLSDDDEDLEDFAEDGENTHDIYNSFCVDF